MSKTKNYSQTSQEQSHDCLQRDVSDGIRNLAKTSPLSQNIILDLCGGTGSWSEPFKKAGFKVIVLDIKEGWDIRHFIVDKNKIKFLNLNESTEDKVKELKIFKRKIYGILSAPPCTQFSFARTNAKTPRDLYSGMEVVEACLRIIWNINFYMANPNQKKSHLKFWALENPNGFLKYFLGKPALEFSPFEYGDDYKKKTHIWGDFDIPEKKPIKCTKPKFDKLSTKEIHPEYYGKLTRQERRAITPKGFAEAFCKAQLKRGGKK